jgi:DNA-binding SARP family transcriptional activator
MTDTMLYDPLAATTAPPRGARPAIDRTLRYDGGWRSSGVCLRLLGGFELSLDGVAVELQPAMQRLTAFVALTPRGVGRMFAAFQLWPDKSEKRALANLRSTLWRLNQLQVPVIDVSPMKLSLAPNVWLDTRNEAKEFVDSVDIGGVPAPFQTLLTDLLPDWYDDWLIVERERIRLLRLAALETRARESIAAGHPTVAIQFALAALSIEGARVSAHQLLVEAHLAEGNECEARRERLRFERCTNEATI